MEIKEVINTIEDQQKWKEFLKTQSKEELAELILDRMVRDDNFSREVYCKLSQLEASIDVIIDSYEIAVKKEMNQKVADVDYLELLSDRVINSIDSTKNLLEQIKLYVSVILSLDSALDNGAGFDEENEDILFQVIDDCCNLMVNEIKEKYGELSDKELDEICDFLKSGSENYEPVDGDNRLETAFKELVSLARGRRIT